MQVFTERVILQTDHAGHLTRLPKLPSNARVEAIFIVLDQKPQRKPHEDIMGKTLITGDIFSSVPESDWNLTAWLFLIPIYGFGG